MRRVLKWAAALALVGMVALAGAGLWLRHAYPPERLRALASAKLGERLGRQVEIGDAHIGLVRGLELASVRISERPNFSAGIFVEVGRMRLVPRLLPLLARKLIIRSVDLERPRVRIQRNAQGAFNFSDLLHAPPGTPEPAATQDSARSGLFISRARLTDGEFTFRDEGQDATATLRALEANLSGLSLTDPFGVRIKADLLFQRGKAAWAGPLALQARVSPGPDFPLKIERFSLRLGTSTLELAGTVTPLPTPRAEVTLSLSPLDAADIGPVMTLPAFLAGARLTGKWTVRASSAAATAEGTFDADAAGVRLTGALSARSSFELGDPRHEIHVEPQSLRIEKSPLAPGLLATGPLGGRWKVEVSSGQWTTSGEIAADGVSATYQNWLEKPAGARLTVEGSARPGPGGLEFFAELRAPKITLRPGGPWPEKVQVTGPLAATLEAQGRPNRVAFEGTAEGPDLDLTYGTIFRKPPGSAFLLAAAGTFLDQRDIDLTYATLQTPAGTLDIRGQIEKGPAARRIDLVLNGKMGDLARLPPLLPSVQEYRPRGEATFRADVRGVTPAPKVLGEFTLKNAALTPLPGVDLSQLTGEGRFGEGRIDLRSLNGKAFGSPFTLSGQINHRDRLRLVLDGTWTRLEVDKVLAVFSKGGQGAPATAKATSPPGPAPIARAQGKFRIGEITHPHYVGRDFEFRWDLTDVGPDLSVLSGTSSVKAASGEIRNVPVAKKINKLLGREGSGMTYKRLAGHFTVKRGLAETRDFTLDSDQTDFTARGTVQLVGNLDSNLSLSLKLPPGSVRGSVGDWITAEDGRPTIEAALKGPLGDPEVKVNYRDAVRRAAQDILRKTIGGWKGKPDAPEAPTDPAPPANPDGSEPPTAAPQETLEDAARRGLEKIFKKR